MEKWSFPSAVATSATADVVIGNNGAGLFVWASGALGVSENNLGGRTEGAGASPSGLSGFRGDIAIVNIYDFFLDASEIQDAFNRVATVPDQPDRIVLTQIAHDELGDTLTVTWESVPGTDYEAQFSTNLEDWFFLDGPFNADATETTEVLDVPPMQDIFFVRIREQGP